MEVLSKLKILEKRQIEDKTFKILILDCKSRKNSFDGKILGLKLVDWIKLSCGNITNTVIEYDEKSSVLDFVGDKIKDDCDFTIILLSKAPLITNSTLNAIMEYCKYKSITVCKLPLGYVVDNKRFLSKKYIVDSVYSQNINDFYIVESKVQFNYAFKILQERINNYYINNGVEILNPINTYIEPLVNIEKGVIIYPNNTIKGETYLLDGVILKENNVIENSTIGKDSCICGSVISDSIIDEGVCISHFCEINKSKIGKFSIIQKGVLINNYKLGKNSKIEPNSVLGRNE